ncbi:MAG: hypothetical protein J2P47_05380 [Acetobacteraceae bacterium]|nr:hypothetical protein [Acetobacteraceae bacterium]
MRTAMIAAAAALGLMGAQAAYADAVQRYESGASIQSMAAPQQARPYAQAEQTGTDGGSFRQAQAEQTGTDGGSFRQAQAEQTGTDGGSFRQA